MQKIGDAEVRRPVTQALAVEPVPLEPHDGHYIAPLAL